MQKNSSIQGFYSMGTAVFYPIAIGIPSNY